MGFSIGYRHSNFRFKHVKIEDCKTAVRNEACDVTIGFRITSKLIDAHSRPIKANNSLTVFFPEPMSSAFEKLTISNVNFHKTL